MITTLRHGWHRIRYCAVRALAPELDLDLDLRARLPQLRLRPPTGDNPLEYLLESVELSLGASLQFPALATALVIPDILGGIGKRATGMRYAAWFDANTKGYELLDGAACYALRCKLLHQASLELDAADVWEKSKLHGRIKDFLIAADPIGTIQFDAGETIVIDGPALCRTIVKAARDWYAHSPSATRALVEALISERPDIKHPTITWSEYRIIAVRP